ncbi:unnamed protein product [Staurois parvus]|uniref:Uncharacterized protein n=1 Tax=Staurois parvus TaxID=386267 RepID=A0ABN9AGP3_9NEOB|nr:unnamed protein product [Staurois parvus]
MHKEGHLPSKLETHLGSFHMGIPFFFHQISHIFQRKNESVFFIHYHVLYSAACFFFRLPVGFSLNPGQFFCQLWLQSFLVYLTLAWYQEIPNFPLLNR